LTFTNKKGLNVYFFDYFIKNRILTNLVEKESTKMLERKIFSDPKSRFRK